MPAFLKRISRDNLENKYYYDLSINPYADDDTGIPNCTCYALGRASEIKGDSVRDDIMLKHYPDAKRWWEVTKWQKTTTDFKEGDTLVWSGTYGHVATVELVKQNSLIISQSNYTRNRLYIDKYKFQSLEIEKPLPGKITPKIGLPFLGAIHNPYALDIRVKRDDKKYQVQVIANSLRARDNALNVRQGLFILEGLYNIIETKQKDGYTWAKISDNVWFALNDKDKWTVTYQISSQVQENKANLNESKKEEQIPMEKKNALEGLKNALKQANEKVAILEKEQSEKDKLIVDLEKENKALKDFKQKIKELVL